MQVPELLLAGVATTLILLEVLTFDPGEPVLARVLAGAMAGLSLALIRRRPLTGYVINGSAVLALIALGHPSDFYQWTNLVAMIGVATRLPTRPALISLTIGWVGVISYFVRFPEEGNAVLAGAIVAIWTAAWFAGRAQYARVVGMEAKHQGDLARAALAAQQARAELDTERSRIARDLHDIIGHAVNVMVIHAGAGQGMNDADSDTRATFETIATTGRAALADLDRMLGLLEGGPERAPLPGIAQLADLGASISGEALSVHVTVDGDPGAVSPGVGVTVYRVAQEALTNVLKHAGATRAQVSVIVADEVTFTVTDDGQGGLHRPGRGLTGIEERVAMHGGTVRFGPGPHGGFEVWCRLPRSLAG